MTGLHPRLLPWLREVEAWLWEARLLWVIFLSVVVAFAAVGCWPDEDTIRRSGLTFEVLGIVSLAVERLGQESQARQRGEEAIREDMVANETGGIPLTVLGLAWFFLGAVMGSGAPELAGAAQWLFGEPEVRGVPAPLWMYLAGHVPPAFPR